MIYEFICVDCCEKRLAEYYDFIGEKSNRLTYSQATFDLVENLELNEFKFDLLISGFYNNDTKAHCPLCSSENTKRCLSSFSVHWGLSAAEKVAGTTKQRREMGNFMKDQKDKRKKASAPGTREHDSNEFWIGNETKNGTISRADMK